MIHVLRGDTDGETLSLISGYRLLFHIGCSEGLLMDLSIMIRDRTEADPFAICVEFDRVAFVLLDRCFYADIVEKYEREFLRSCLLLISIYEPVAKQFSPCRQCLEGRCSIVSSH